MPLSMRRGWWRERGILVDVRMGRLKGQEFGKGDIPPQAFA